MVNKEELLEEKLKLLNQLDLNKNNIQEVFKPREQVKMIEDNKKQEKDDSMTIKTVKNS